MAVYKQTGKLPEKLKNLPKLPEEFAYLWQWFGEVRSGEDLTFLEIESWSRLTRKNITATETKILKQLDQLYWKTLHGRSCPSNSKG